MTKVDIYSGFLGAGKTTLIKKLITEAYAGEKLVLIENEFGEIGIDGGFLQDAGINITEMNSGCICCSLVGDFGKALEKVIAQYHPDRILIEPSGVGKLSDVVNAVDSLYRTLPDKEHRAIAGLSIGAMQAMHISANSPDMFGYVGLFSAMVHPVLRKSNYSAFYKDFNDKLETQFATPPMLYTIMIGNSDFYYPRMKRYARHLKREGYPYELVVVSGGHQWYNWTAFANQFMQRLF